MSPILTRPVREQLEHDRVIRLLEARYRRQHEVAINLSGERNHSVMVGELAVYPDLLLFGQERKRLEGTVEVETGESVNYLEALAEWGPFSRLRVPFALYVPPNAVDSARRLCTEHNIAVAEIWTYHMGIDQVRFTMIHRAADGKGKGARAPRTEITIKQSDVVVVRGTPPLPPASPVPVPAPATPVKVAPAATAAETRAPRPRLTDHAGVKAAPAAKAAETGAPPKAARAAKAAKVARPASAAKPVKRAAASKSAPKAAPRMPVKVSAKAKATIKAKAEAKARALAKTKATMAARTAKPSRAAKTAAKPARIARQPARSAKVSKPARAARRR